MTSNIRIRSVGTGKKQQAPLAFDNFNVERIIHSVQPALGEYRLSRGLRQRSMFHRANGLPLVMKINTLTVVILTLTIWSFPTATILI